MSTLTRSVCLKPEGVKKLEEHFAQDVFAFGRFLEKAELSRNTVRSLMKGQPVLTRTQAKVTAYLNIKLAASDWGTETPEPAMTKDAPELPPDKRTITSVDIIPLSECTQRMAVAQHISFLNTWVVNRDSFTQVLVTAALERRVKTRILVLDPDSVHVACRGLDICSGDLDRIEDARELVEEEQRAKQRMYNGIISALEDISRKAARMSAPRTPHPNLDYLEVRVYDSTPTTSLIIIDDYVCQGIYWRDYGEGGTPHFEYTQPQNPPWYQRATAHFEAIWNSRRTYRYNTHAGVIERGSRSV